MPSPQDHLQVLVERAWPGDEWRDAHIVLAVSAGPDSVALLRATLAGKLCHVGRGRVHVAHFHHGLRGREADADQAWLELLCRRLEVPLTVGRAADAATLSTERGDAPTTGEAAARHARYEFLRVTAEQLGARYVAVAHTADDQVETVLHRIVRGTGLAGLAGMPFSRPLSPSVTLVRPLLAARRRDVMQYLTAIGQDYRIDASNEDRRFTRNRLRHELLPMLRRRYNTEVDAALLRLASQAGEAQQWIAKRAANFVEQCVVVEAGDLVRIDCAPLAGQPPLIVREVCKAAWDRARWPKQAANFDVWRQLAELVLADGDARAITLPGQIRAIRHGNALVLASDRGFS